MWQLLSGLESSPQVELAKKDLITRVPGIDKPPEVKFSAKFAEATHAFQKAMRARDNTLEKIIKLEDAPAAYKEFDDGSAFKYVIDPHGSVAA